MAIEQAGINYLDNDIRLYVILYIYFWFFLVKRQNAALSFATRKGNWIL